MAFEAVHSWTFAGLLGAFVDLAIAYCLLCGSAFAFFPSKFLNVFGAFEAVHSWTFAVLLAALVDLAIAYCLLCGSAFAFFPLKFLNVLGLYVPCTCSGIFGYQNSSLCLQKLLIDLPTSRISYVQELVKNRFPFDLIWLNHRSCNLHAEGVREAEYENGVTEELEGEACSSSFSSPRFQSSVDKESGYDAKGKRISNQKLKSGIRRRRRASLGYGRPSTVLYSSSHGSVGIGFPHLAYDGIEMGSENSESLDPAKRKVGGLRDDGNASNGLDFDGRTRSSFEISGPCGKGKDIKENPLSAEKFSCNAEDKLGGVENDAHKIRMLEKALEEEKAARAALYQELEKERAAAATAADEAMAMIMRLQEDKASVEMEARQYQRMIEEKFAYDEEEMNILKEILVRRERENHFLEKELEAYCQINFPGNEEHEDDLSCKVNCIGSNRQRSSFSTDSNEYSLVMLQQVENTESIVEKEVAISENCSSKYEEGITLASGKEMIPKHREFTPDLSSSGGLLQNTVNAVGKEKARRDISLISQEIMTPQSYGGNGEEMGKDGKHWNLVGCDVDSSPDTESTVYDVHVIDDKTTFWKAGGTDSGSLCSVPSDYVIWKDQDLNDCPNTSMTEIEPNVHGSSLDRSSMLPGPGNSECKTLGIDLQRHSSSAVNSERLKIDTQVEWLREKLQIVQEEKGNLTLCGAQGKVNAQLKLVEELVNQLREIQQKEPLRQASLPPSSSKVSLKKRRCRSVPWEAFESA